MHHRRIGREAEPPTVLTEPQREVHVLVPVPEVRVDTARLAERFRADEHRRPRDAVHIPGRLFSRDVLRDEIGPLEEQPHASVLQRPVGVHESTRHRAHVGLELC